MRATTSKPSQSARQFPTICTSLPLLKCFVQIELVFHAWASNEASSDQIIYGTWMRIKRMPASSQRHNGTQSFAAVAACIRSLPSPPFAVVKKRSHRQRARREGPLRSLLLQPGSAASNAHTRLPCFRRWDAFRPERVAMPGRSRPPSGDQIGAIKR